jgi:hypothetical protein
MSANGRIPINDLKTAAKSFLSYFAATQDRDKLD